LEKTKEMMNNFSKDKILQIRAQRDKLSTENQKLEEELMRLKKEEDNTKKHYENHTKAMDAKIKELIKEYNEILQKINKKASDEQSEDHYKKELEEQAALNEHKKAEKLRPVKFSQVEMSALDINRRLTLRRIEVEEAFDYLLANEDKDINLKDTMLSTLETNLRKEPFFIGKDNAKLVARYLIEDNFEETIEFDPKRTQSKLTVKSIFKTMVGHVKVRKLEELKKLYSQIHSAVNANKNGITLKLQDKEKRDIVPLTRFIEEIRGATDALLKLNEEQKNFLIITMIERSDSSKDIRIESIFSYFSPKEFEEMYVNSPHHASSSRKGGHKKTFTNSIKQMTKRDSHSEMSDDGKQRSESKGNTVVMPQAGGKQKQPADLSDYSAGMGPSRSQAHIPIKEELMPNESSKEDDDMSRESSIGPPPKMEVNEVKTFNNPETKEKIYTLEQIKAAGQVKNAFGTLMFGNKKPEGNQTDAPPKSAETVEKKPNPLEFMLAKKPTYQDTNKIDPKTGTVVEVAGKRFEAKVVTEDQLTKDNTKTQPNQQPLTSKIGHPADPTDAQGSSSNRPPTQTTNQGQAKGNETVLAGKGADNKHGAPVTGNPAKPAFDPQAQPPKQKQPLIIDDSDDLIDEDDEIDRMLAENKDEEF
jgi:hypothetical protein